MGVPCGSSLVGRASPCQGEGRRFESGLPLSGADSASEKKVKKGFINAYYGFCKEKSSNG